MPKSGTFLRPAQVEKMEGELNSLQETLDNPLAQLQDRAALQKRVRTLRAGLEENTPPDLSPAQKDLASARLGALREEITEAMPTQEEMRCNPPGARKRQVKYNRTMTQKVLDAKNILLMLNKGTMDPDVANIEEWRPRGTPFNPNDAQIQRKTFVGIDKSPAYEAGWEAAFGERDKRLEAMQAELAALKAKISTPIPVEVAAPPKESPRPFSATCGPCGKVVHGKTAGTAANGLRAHQRHCVKTQAAQQ
jgi:hypothetical protein